jgi:hypothetical protein
MHFPVAKSKLTNLLVNVSDVPNGKACNCYCDGCKQDLIAANNGEIRKAHFKHEKRDPNCPFDANYETYVHWLAKEIFKTIENINLPSILYDTLNFETAKLTEIVNKLKIHLNYVGILESDYNPNQLNFTSIVLQNSKNYKIDGWAIEQVMETHLGKIVVDVVLQINKNNLFVEPYWTNPLTTDKLIKIASCNISTIAINLSPFIKRQFFTIQEFTKFLQEDINHKSWAFINSIKADQLVSNLFNENFKLKLNAKKDLALKNRKINEELKSKMVEINQKEVELLRLRAEASKLADNITKINFSDLFS